MSVFDTAVIECGACSGEVEFELVLSVNADRRPDLRERILDGTFQTIACPHCSTPVRPPPSFVYLELRRGHWIAVHPRANVVAWQTHEMADLETFAEAFGDTAPPPAREIGAGLAPRVVFGWAALQEKLLLADLGLKDDVLELLKCALLHDTDGLTLAADSEMRLSGGDEESLTFDWLLADTTEVLQVFKVPRAAYAEIAEDPAGWEALRDRIAGPAFTDIRRATSEGGEAAA